MLSNSFILEVGEIGDTYQVKLFFKLKETMWNSVFHEFCNVTAFTVFNENIWYCYIS